MKQKVDWKWKKLSEVCEKPEYGYTTSAKPDGQGPLFVRTTDISNGDICWKSVPFCAEPPIDEERYRLKDGDILISRAGSVGVSVVVKTPPRAVFASYLIRFRPGKELIPFYAGFFLKSNMFFAQLGARTSGTTLPGVNATNLSNVKVPIPPIKIQRKIASILEKAESAREKRKEANRLTDEFLKATFSEIFDIYISGKKECHKKAIGDAVNFIDYRGKTPQKSLEGIPLITAKNIREGYISKEPKEYISEEVYEAWMTRGFPKDGDVLFTTEAPIGNVAKLNVKEKIALAQRIIALQCNKKSIMSDYLVYCLMSNKIKSEVFKRTTGSTAKGIRSKEFAKIEIPIPPIKEQQKFADLVQKVEKLKEKQRESEKELNNLFNSLMQKAFRGELVS
ncbi:MAG: restriction endonuclease subunit S [Candidatus Scalinduaceae bacterium]